MAKNGMVMVSESELMELRRKAALGRNGRVEAKRRPARMRDASGRWIDDPSRPSVIELKAGDHRPMAHTDEVWAVIHSPEAIAAVKAVMTAK